MVLTKEQLSELICKHSERENGLQDLLEILLESMMVSERREYLRENSASGNKCNGFHLGHSYGLVVRCRSGYLEIATGIFIPEFWQSCAIRKTNANALPDAVYEMTYAGTSWRGIPGYLRRALQQGEHFADAGLSSRGCLSMAHALSGGVLPNHLHRLRTHEDSPQAERRNRGFLCGTCRA